MSNKEKINEILNINLDCNNEFLSRKKKLIILRKNLFNPYSNKFSRLHSSIDLINQYSKKSRSELFQLNIFVSIAGRIILKRVFGKASFLNLQDSSGCIQVYFSYKELGEYFYEKFLSLFDIGDFIGVEGILFKTRTEELSINCKKFKLLSKSLRPLPEKFHGLVDRELKYRKRYLDLISNKKSKEVFIVRSKIIKTLRSFMEKERFLEVETPMIQSIPGGASARPFITYYNNLKMNMYLRVSPELYLKRLLVGGFERVFEINRSFRNEGSSLYHNPEFTMMEFYIAYFNYKDLMKFIEKMFLTITTMVFKTSKIKYRKYLFDFSKPFNILTMKDAILKYNKKIEISDLDDKSKLYKILKFLKIKTNKEWGIGRMQYEIFKSFAENHLIEPTFITEYPTEVSPLALSNKDDPFLADRFELFIAGYEIGNGFSELNDPEEQSKRFIDQIKNKKKRKENKSLFYDDDYILALEHGMPPAAGFGIGIDRLVMLLTNSNAIRDVILFPMLRSSK